MKVILVEEPGGPTFCESIHKKMVEHIMEENRKIEEMIWKDIGYTNKFEGILSLIKKSFERKSPDAPVIRFDVPKKNRTF